MLQVMDMSHPLEEPYLIESIEGSPDRYLILCHSGEQFEVTCKESSDSLDFCVAVEKACDQYLAGVGVW